MKIDMFTHVLTPGYVTALRKLGHRSHDQQELEEFVTELTLDEIGPRLAVLEKHPDVFQVLTMHAPPLERLAEPREAIEVARIANDEMAEIVAANPQRFTAAAILPMVDTDAALKEAERAVTRLNFKGIQIYTDVNGETLDLPRYRPLFALMEQLDATMWIHPWNPPEWRKAHFPEEESVAWPFQSTMAQIDLAKAGIFQQFPKIKIIIHHGGALVPFFHHRMRLPPADLKKFYVDTALSGNTIALNCSYAFYGADHIVFGTDMRGGDKRGDATSRVITSIAESDIPDDEKTLIYEANAKRLLKL